MRAKNRFWERRFPFGLLAFCLLGAGNTFADGPRQLRTLQTLDGREFHDVKIESVDPNGILFRHRNGAAKIRFVHLEPELREAYGYLENEAHAFETERPNAEVAVTDPAPAGMEADGGELTPLRLTFRVRTTFPVQALVSRNGCGPTSCGASLASWPWPSHWSRFHPGLAYSLFPCRQLAERDFLITSGILPRPPGVCTWRLR